MASGQELFAYANGGGIIRFEDGKAVYAFNEPAAVEAVELWKELDQVHGCVMVGDKYDVRQEFNKGNVAMFRLDLFGLPDHARDVDFEYGWVFIPKGPRADEYVTKCGALTCLSWITEKATRSLSGSYEHALWKQRANMGTWLYMKTSSLSIHAICT